MNDPFGQTEARKGIFARLGLSSTAVAIVALVIAACGGVVGSGIAESGQQALTHERNVDNNALARIQANIPVPVLSNSSDASNQAQFVTEQSDPNKVEYLELVGYNGAPYAHYTIKGQVSAMDTSQTNPWQSSCQEGGHENYSCVGIGMAEPNGIYGGADAGHFAFTTAGALIEWEGDFVTSDQPFTIKAPVLLQQDENIPPSETNLHGVLSGAKLPNGRTH